MCGAVDVYIGQPIPSEDLCQLEGTVSYFKIRHDGFGERWRTCTANEKWHSLPRSHVFRVHGPDLNRYQIVISYRELDSFRFGYVGLDYFAVELGYRDNRFGLRFEVLFRPKDSRRGFSDKGSATLNSGGSVSASLRPCPPPDTSFVASDWYAIEIKADETSANS